MRGPRAGQPPPVAISLRMPASTSRRLSAAGPGPRAAPTSRPKHSPGRTRSQRPSTATRRGSPGPRGYVLRMPSRSSCGQGPAPRAERGGAGGRAGTGRAPRGAAYGMVRCKAEPPGSAWPAATWSLAPARLQAPMGPGPTLSPRTPVGRSPRLLQLPHAPPPRQRPLRPTTSRSLAVHPRPRRGPLASQAPPQPRAAARPRAGGPGLGTGRRPTELPPRQTRVPGPRGGAGLRPRSSARRGRRAAAGRAAAAEGRLGGRREGGEAAGVLQGAARGLA
jgi:hypothetical protein